MTFFSKILMIANMDNSSKLFPWAFYSGFTSLNTCNSRSRSARHHFVYILHNTETKRKHLSTKYEIQFYRKEGNKRTWRYQMQNKSTIEESAIQSWNGIYITALVKDFSKHMMNSINTWALSLVSQFILQMKWRS